MAEVARKGCGNAGAIPSWDDEGTEEVQEAGVPQIPQRGML